MDKFELYKQKLEPFLPAGSAHVITEWIFQYNFDLRITKSRASKYGDYRSPYNGSRHLITINHNLHPYQFLITMIHEVAHLVNFEKHKNKVKPHGTEWKNEYRMLMMPFLQSSIFPDDVRTAITNYMENPAAATCSDLELLRVMKKYAKGEAFQLLEELPANSVFKFRNKYFTKGPQVRKRFKCKENNTNYYYLFNPLTEVKLVSNELF